MAIKQMNKENISNLHYKLNMMIIINNNDKRLKNKPTSPYLIQICEGMRKIPE